MIENTEIGIWESDWSKFLLQGVILIRRTAVFKQITLFIDAEYSSLYFQSLNGESKKFEKSISLGDIILVETRDGNGTLDIALITKKKEYQFIAKSLPVQQKLVNALNYAVKLNKKSATSLKRNSFLVRYFSFSARPSIGSNNIAEVSMNNTAADYHSALVDTFSIPNPPLNGGNILPMVPTQVDEYANVVEIIGTNTEQCAIPIVEKPTYDRNFSFIDNTELSDEEFFVQLDDLKVTSNDWKETYLPLLLQGDMFVTPTCHSSNVELKLSQNQQTLLFNEIRNGTQKTDSWTEIPLLEIKNIVSLRDNYGPTGFEIKTTKFKADFIAPSMDVQLNWVNAIKAAMLNARMTKFDTVGNGECENVEQYLERANNCLQLGQYDNAISCYSKASLLDPLNQIVYSNRSAAYLSIGDSKNALVDGLKCIELDPTWHKGYSRYGAALFELHRYEDAYKVFECGIKLSPNDSYLARAMNELQQIKRADGDVWSCTYRSILLNGQLFISPGYFYKKVELRLHSDMDRLMVSHVDNSQANGKKTGEIAFEIRLIDIDVIELLHLHGPTAFTIVTELRTIEFIADTVNIRKEWMVGIVEAVCRSL